VTFHLGGKGREGGREGGRERERERERDSQLLKQVHESHTTGYKTSLTT